MSQAFSTYLELQELHFGVRGGRVIVGTLKLISNLKKLINWGQNGEGQGKLEFFKRSGGGNSPLTFIRFRLVVKHATKLIRTKDSTVLL
jgi:hypothetical protein